MTKKSMAKSLPKVKVASKTLPKVAPKALGAELIYSVSKPIDLLEIKDTLQALLQSTGGRPGIKSAPKRIKIPKIGADWFQLKIIGVALSNMKDVPHVPSLAQLATIILHLGLSRISKEEILDAILKKGRI